MGNLLHPLGALATHSSSSWCRNATACPEPTQLRGQGWGLESSLSLSGAPVHGWNSLLLLKASQQILPRSPLDNPLAGPADGKRWKELEFPASLSHRDPSPALSQLPQLQPCPRDTPMPACLSPCSKGCLGIPPARNSAGSGPESRGDAPVPRTAPVSQDLCSPLCWLHSQWKPPAPPRCSSLAVGSLLGSGCCSPWNVARHKRLWSSSGTSSSPTTARTLELFQG